MQDPKVKTRCKFYNCGFCKFGDKCRFAHFPTICLKTKWKIKTCRNRHPKYCKYKEECRRRTTCLYRHVQIKNNPDHNKLLEDENESLRTQIKEMKDKLDETSVNLRIMVKEIDTLKTKAEDVETSRINKLEH